jgi:hypothetical protein
MNDDDSPIPSDVLPRDVAPPAHLESTIRARLTEEDLLRPPRQQWRTAFAAAAVFAVGVATGIAWRSDEGPSQADSTPRFLLLLYPGTRPPGGAPDEARAVREYAAWAAAERARGRVVTGERLAANALVVGDDSRRSESDDTALQGFFLISARSADEAGRVAAASPHVRDGGRVIVRPIDTPR